jgi:amino acid adenylation domain-containing protein
MDRSPQMLAVILGIWKAGGAYTPLEKSYPPARMEKILKKTKARFAFVDEPGQAGISRTSGVGPIVAGELIENPSIVVDIVTDIQPPAPHELAYVLFTSGSSGEPKGVMIEHAGMLNHLWGKVHDLNINADDVIAQTANITFDISIWQMFAALIKGGRTLIYDSEVIFSPRLLLNQLADDKVSIAELVPSYLAGLLDGELETELPHLRYMLVTGEELKLGLVQRWFAAYPGKCLVNAYGPTEASDDVCHYFLESTSSLPIIPVGRPLPNFDVYILDTDKKLCAIGVEGEICVSGIGVGRGYLEDAAETRKRFLNNPFSKNTPERMFLTGDAGKMMPDGNIVFLGRLDDQLKINGNRIEPGEIEHFLLQTGRVRQALVTGRKDEDDAKQLIAYVVPDNEYNRNSVLALLRDQFPSYMVPAMMLEIDSFPLNENGKIDKKRLPVSLPVNADKTETLVQLTALEQIVSAVWQKILGVDNIGPDDDFFAMGGHSLSAIRMGSMLSKKLEKQVTLQDIFSYPTIRKLSSAIESSGALSFEEIPLTPEFMHYPLSHAQKRLWITDRLEDTVKTAYNIFGSYFFESGLVVDSFGRAFEQLVDRHESLRTIFVAVNGEPMQKICKRQELNYKLELFDLTAESSPDIRAREICEREASRPFDLSTGPLIRPILLRIAEDQWIFLLSVHHIICDGWSMEVMLKEVLTFYNNGLTGASNNLPLLRIQYKDYAVWQANLMSGDSYSFHKQFWLETLSGDLPVLEMGTDFKRPEIRRSNGAVSGIVLGRDVQQKIEKAVAAKGITLFTWLYTSVLALLHRYTGQQDIIVGTAVSGREHADLENQVGFYVNMIPLRTKFNGNLTFEELLDRTRETVFRAFEHQVYSFDLLVEDLGVQRERSRLPLFDTVVTLDNVNLDISGPDHLRGVAVRDFVTTSRIAKFDLRFNFLNNTDGIFLELEYSTDLFKKERIERMLNHYSLFVANLIENGTVAIGKVNMLDEKERAKILHEFSAGTGFALPEKSIGRLFEEQAERTPGLEAIVYEGVSLSYRELNRRSNQFARYLIKKCDITAGDLVGVVGDRTEWMMIAILGILKAGAAYLPLDIEYPAERKRYMLVNSGAKLVVCRPEDVEGVLVDAGVSILIMDERILEKVDSMASRSVKVNVGPEAIAYVMYTSGSTGRPKGVLISHKNIVSLIAGANYVQLTDSPVLLSNSSPSFDATTFEYWMMLLNGGKLVLSPERKLLDSQVLRSEIETHRVNYMFMTPGWFNQLVDIDVDIFAGLHTLVLGGEKVSEPQIKKVLKRYPMLNVVNGYGPTESTTFSLFHRANYQDLNSTLPIGRPCTNRSVYILNDQLELCPEGVEGEICIGGKGLSLGYVGDEELTMQKFVSNPYAKGERLYRSGDIGRYRWDGSVEFVGRRDSQVKLRGHRIELGEIEVIAGGYVGLSQPLAMIGGEGSDRYIVLYYRSEESLEEGKLRKYLKERLPGYMQPAYIVWMKEYPLTINGKVDYRSLPDAVNLGRGERAEKEEKLSEVEAMVLGVWERVLGRSGIGVQDSFFELGGDSIKAIKVASGIFKEWNKRISLADIFMNPTVSGLSALLAVDKSVLYAEIPKAPSQTLYPLSHAQSRLWIADQTDPAVKSVFNISGAYSIRGEIDKSALKQAFITVINRHESLRTIFVTEKGIPYQKIITTEESGYDFSFVDLSNAPDPQNEARNLCEAASRHCFDLSRGPLIITRLYQVASDEALLFMVLHHIICDGWSIDNMTREILSYYEAYHSGQEINSNPLAIQYKDFAAWQNQLINENLLDEHRAFWEKQLVEPAQYVQLPVDYKRTATRAYKGGIIRADISAEVALRVHSVSIKHDTTIFTTLFSLVNILLFRYCGQEDMAIGVPTTGRFRKELEDQIGFYVNTLPVRMHVDPRLTYEQFLDGTKGCLLEVFRHEAYPYILIKDKMHTGSHAGKDIFNVMVQLDRSPQFTQASNSALRNVQIEPYTFERISSKYDLTFFFQSGNDPDQLSMAIEYDSLLFKEESIEKMKRDLLCIIDCLMQNEKLLITDRRLVDSSAEEMEYSNFIKPM